MSSIIRRLRGIPPSPEELEKRKRERHERESERLTTSLRNKEIRQEEREAKYEGYKQGRIAGAKKRGYESGLGSTRTLSERAGGLAKSVQGMGHGFSREMGELGGLFTPRVSRPRQRSRGGSRNITVRVVGSHGKVKQVAPKRRSQARSRSDLDWIME